MTKFEKNYFDALVEALEPKAAEAVKDIGVSLNAEEMVKIYQFVQKNVDPLKVGDSYRRKNDKYFRDVVWTPKSYMETSSKELSQCSAKTWNRTRKFSDTFHEKGLWFEGHNPETDQMCFKLKFDQNKPFEDQLAVLEFINFIKPNKEGEFSIGIFEFSCSERGIWRLYKDSRGAFSIARTSYGQKGNVKEFAGLMEALKYVYDNLPYKQR